MNTITNLWPDHYTAADVVSIYNKTGYSRVTLQGVTSHVYRWLGWGFDSVRRDAPDIYKMTPSMCPYGRYIYEFVLNYLNRKQGATVIDALAAAYGLFLAHGETVEDARALTVDLLVSLGGIYGREQRKELAKSPLEDLPEEEALLRAALRVDFGHVALNALGIVGRVFDPEAEARVYRAMGWPLPEHLTRFEVP